MHTTHGELWVKFPPPLLTYRSFNSFPSSTNPSVLFFPPSLVIFSGYHLLQMCSSKALGCRTDWDHPWTNHHNVPISSAFHHSGLISVSWFLFIHIAYSHTHSHHTFKKVTKNVKCFHNPTKPHLLLQPPALLTVLLLNKHKQVQKIQQQRQQAGSRAVHGEAQHGPPLGGKFQVL